MALRTSPRGINLIKQFEGLKLEAYVCPAGVLTIGYGHTSAAGAPVVIKGMKITREEAERIVRADIDKFEDGVEKLVEGVNLNVCQFDALVSLAFNIGLGAFKKSTLLKKIKAGEFDAVPAQLMRWNKAGGRELEGLTRRRRAEAALWRSLPDEAQNAAEKITALPMPQAVDAPVVKNVAKSTEAQAAAGGGLAGLVVAGKAVNDAAKDFTGATAWETLVTLGPWVALAGVILLATGYVIYRRRERLKEGS
jgi:GH24 family phage-related lysozyme (muramidase)